MLMLIDGWTIAHGTIGFCFVCFGVSRRLAYLFFISWEVYQLYFHYLPLDYSLGYIWLNSVADIAAGVLCYELYKRHRLPIQLFAHLKDTNSDCEILLVYAFLSLGITWLFWDDSLRLQLTQKLPQIPLLLGALSPIFTVNIMRSLFQESEMVKLRLFV